MQYRKATTLDAHQLATLRIKQLHEEAVNMNHTYDHTMNEALTRELVNYFTSSIIDDSLVVWLAIDNDMQDNDVVIATSGVCFFLYPPTLTNITGKTAYITNVYTEPAYRKQGIASDLLDLTMKEIAMRGCKLARLHASAEARGLYEKVGFVDADGFMVKRDC